MNAGKRFRTLIVVVAALLPVAATADDSLGSRLVGSWMYVGTIPYMGATDPCQTKSEIFKFKPGGSSLSYYCKDGNPATADHTWKLSDAPNGDTLITIDGRDTYVLLIGNGDNEMHLRKKADSQTKPFVDKKFQRIKF